MAPKISVEQRMGAARTLDIVVKQILVCLKREQFVWQRRILLVHIGGSKWIRVSLDFLVAFAGCSAGCSCWIGAGLLLQVGKVILPYGLICLYTYYEPISK